MKTKSRIPTKNSTLNPQPLAAPNGSEGGSPLAPQPSPLTLAPALPATVPALVPASAPVSSDQVVAVVNTKPLPAQPRSARRHGRVAQLPKLERDMVNRMLWNGVPYKNIVAALDEVGYTVTERNISSWATGGYLEWRLEQEAVLENRLDQDHLLDFLRRDDAPELPEVGLQAAATRLSQVFLQKLARADDPEAQIDNYSKLVELLCRLNREIAATQKSRDDSRRSLGPEHDPARVKEVEQLSTIDHERFYSNPPADSELSKPAVPPLLPPIPTASFLAEQAREDKHQAELDHLERQTAFLQAVLGKKPSTPHQATATPANHQPPSDPRHSTPDPRHSTPDPRHSPPVTPPSVGAR